MSAQVMVVPMDEMFEIIEKMSDYANISYEQIKHAICIEEEKQHAKGVISTLCEFHSGAIRTKEYILEVMSKDVPVPPDAKIPENSIAVKDEDYVMLTNLMVGMMALELEVISSNISLNYH